MKVAVASIYYAPDSTGIAPYATDLCEALSSAGASVRALVGVPHYPSWEIDPSYRTRKIFHEERAGVAVTRVRHHVPAHPGLAGRARYEISFMLAGLHATRHWTPDVVIAVTPNIGGVVIADRIARRGAGFGVVVQDLVGAAAAQSGVGLGNMATKLLSALETRLLRRADGIGVITPEFRRRIVQGGVDPSRVRDMPNYSRITASELSKGRSRELLGWPTDRILAVHTGNMGQKQNLEVVVEAARLAAHRGDKIEFVIVGDGNQRGHIAKLATGVSTLRLVASVPDRDYPLTLAAADCLILNERPSVVDMSRPSKLTSYFAAGRPVIASTSTHSAAAEEIHRSGAGVVVPPGDPAAMLAAVIAHAKGSAAQKMGLAGQRHAANELSRDDARRRITAFVQDLANGAKDAR